jgi:hypothetical protein
MTRWAKALLLTQDELVPIASVRNDVVDLACGADTPFVPADLAERLPQQLLAPDRTPDREVVPSAPVASVMRISTWMSHRDTPPASDLSAKYHACWATFTSIFIALHNAQNGARNRTLRRCGERSKIQLCV